MGCIPLKMIDHIRKEIPQSNISSEGYKVKVPSKGRMKLRRQNSHNLCCINISNCIKIQQNSSSFKIWGLLPSTSAADWKRRNFYFKSREYTEIFLNLSILSTKEGVLSSLSLIFGSFLSLQDLDDVYVITIGSRGFS